jgi:hypothetical protein
MDVLEGLNFERSGAEARDCVSVDVQSTESNDVIECIGRTERSNLHYGITIQVEESTGVLNSRCNL